MIFPHNSLVVILKLLHISKTSPRSVNCKIIEFQLWSALEPFYIIILFFFIVCLSKTIFLFNFIQSDLYSQRQKVHNDWNLFFVPDKDDTEKRYITNFAINSNFVVKFKIKIWSHLEMTRQRFH
jgi:hypothetical protein